MGLLSTSNNRPFSRPPAIEAIKAFTQPLPDKQDADALTQQFVQTIGPVVARYNRGMSDVQYADLRYKSGYALRLKGLATLSAEAAGKQPETGRR